MKNILAALAGIMIAAIIIFGLEALSTVIFPLSEGANPTDSEWLKENIDLIPTGAMIIVALAHMIGIICGMYVAGLISKTSLFPAYVVGALLLVGTIVNLIMIPHPTWFMITDVIGALIGIGIGKNLAANQLKGA
jgi:hypothetical protein